MPRLEVERVSVTFGGLAALSDVSLIAEGGTVTGLIGPNGAGKTTLFNVICGLQQARGRVLIDGRDLRRLKPHRRARLGLARTFQRIEVFPSLTVYENVLVAAELHEGPIDGGSGTAAIAAAALARVGLAAVADQRVDGLPTGLTRLVEVARTLATRPEVLLLDEPSSGLDDAESQAFGDLLLSLAEDGLAVLLVEHDVDLVMRVCGCVYVLDFGELIASGSPADVRVDPAVVAAYLGGSGDEAP